MSLILCRQEPVESPYYIEELGIHIYSSQELCYVIYNHPLLVMEDFVNERLVSFLRTELRMPFLAERIMKWIEGRGPSDELLFLILQDCAYYSQQEQARYRQEITALRKLSEDEYRKKRADYFYSLGLYGRAISIYEKILDADGRKRLSADFRGRLWNNIAACYAKLFCYQQAMHAYERAWREKQDEEYLKRMYLITVTEPDLTGKENWDELLSPKQKEEWEKEAEEVRREAAISQQATALAQIFERDPIKRLNEASKIVNQWKSEYRKML